MDGGHWKRIMTHTQNWSPSRMQSLNLNDQAKCSTENRRMGVCSSDAWPGLTRGRQTLIHHLVLFHWHDNGQTYGRVLRCLLRQGPSEVYAKAPILFALRYLPVNVLASQTKLVQRKGYILRHICQCGNLEPVLLIGNNTPDSGADA